MTSNNSFYDLNGVYFNPTSSSSDEDARYLIKSSGGTISNNLIVTGSLDVQTSLSLPLGNVETLIQNKQDILKSDSEITILR